MTNKITQLEIDPKLWLRGQSGKLLAKNGQMCVLGFLAKACGYENAQVLDQATPGRLATDLGQNLFPDNVVTTVSKDSFATSGLGFKIAATNDDETIDDSDRRRLLKIQFSELGINLTFSDEITPTV